MNVFWMTMVSLASAKHPKWTGYLQSVAATAAVMPVTYALGEGWTGASNELVPGMLPAVLTGIVLPASVAVGSAGIVAVKKEYEWNGGAAFRNTLLLNTGVYAGGTGMGVSTQSLQDKLMYGAVSALLLPIPSWVSMNVPNTTANLMVVPTDTDWVVNATFQRSF